MLPYVISEACPDYKRPSLNQDFGVVKEDETQTYFLDRICNFILERTDEDSLNCQYDIEKFFENFFDECYMNNSPWEAAIFRNGEWENATPSTEQIWEYIQLIKFQAHEDEENEKRENEEMSKEDKLNVELELNDSEKAVFTEMGKYFENMLDNDEPLTEETFESLKNMNQSELLMYMFNKAFSNISSIKFKENKTLFHNFINICLKFIQIEIIETNKKLEKNHDDAVAEQLVNLINVLNNILVVKETYKF